MCTTNGDPPLTAAILSGDACLVKHLITNGAVINHLNKDDLSPLHFAACVGNLDIFKLLIQSDHEVHVDTTCLSTACKNGKISVVEYLIDKVDINKVDDNCPPALHSAASSGHLGIVEYLVEHSANVNLCDKNGHTPLFFASKSGHLETVGASCLSSVCGGGHLDVVEFLIDKIDVNKVNDICDPPLHCPCSEGHLNIVKYLVEYEAEIYLISFSNDSPLCCAVESGHFPVVEYLVEHGAVMSKAIEIATKRGQKDILDFMFI
ncbi:putative ankyrin repeat protein RF_0381 [Saccostrea cucullata]|uniref:putative ankyrin repeat protein RF_0381 n=1 Tax=Saccostrea cuccullata TaxID=36930 RepID=UPI002ED44B3E